MSSVNKVFLLGNLTRDPELRTLGGGGSVCDLGIACNRSYTTKTGERREEVTFVDVTVWNRQAENCCQYLQKGRPVHVEGYLKLETWEDRETGQKRSKLKVEAERVQFLGGRDGGGDDDQAPPRQQQPPARRPTPTAPPPAEDDEDIPF